VTSTREYFDAKARTWDADPAKVERARIVGEAIVRAVPGLAAKSVLEYGCGTGLLGFVLQPHAAHVTLADSSREMLAVVREKLLKLGAANVAAELLDLTAGPPPPTRFDVACTLLTLHHISDVDDVLRKLFALVASGGILCVSDLDAEDGSFHGSGFEGHHGFDRADLRRRLEAAGFTGVRISTVHSVTKETASGPRTFPLFLAFAQRP
jgi:2-polyprenyl-3-methyl-5-hydroxy-6-metoxy-1,4-benzoquinol methylase